MILILTEEDIIPHYRYELLENIELVNLRVLSSSLRIATSIVLKMDNKVKILKTRNTNLTGKIYSWDDCVKHLLKL